MNNYAIVSRGFQIVTTYLAPYVCKQLKDHCGDNWWNNGVLKILKNRTMTELPKEGDYQTLVNSLDAANLLKLINQHWNTIFYHQLGQIARSWVNELIAFRNQWAHKGSEDFTDSDTQRLLDTAQRLFEKAGVEEGSKEIIKLIAEVEENKQALLKAEKKRKQEELFDELEKKSFGSPTVMLGLAAYKGISGMWKNRK